MARSHGAERFWTLRQEKEGEEGQKGEERKEKEVEGILVVYLDCDKRVKSIFIYTCINYVCDVKA